MDASALKEYYRKISASKGEIKTVTGAPSESAVSFTKRLVGVLESKLTADECRKSLIANAHGIPASSFTGEREQFLESPSLESYLKDSHNRAVKTLTEHAENGTIWFEQTITREVVEFVRENPEILGGVHGNPSTTILQIFHLYGVTVPQDSQSRNSMLFLTET